MASACLVGVMCRYNGESKTDDALAKLFMNGRIIPFCPEILAGLGVPRPEIRLEGGNGEEVLVGKARVVDEKGTDMTERVLEGARKTVEIAMAVSPEIIYLKSGSPSCGCGEGGIKGITAALLERDFVLRSKG